MTGTATPTKRKQILVAAVGNVVAARRRLRRRGREAARRAGAPRRRARVRLRRRWARSRLRGDARLRRPRARRHQPAGRRGRDAVRDGGGRGVGRRADRGRRGDRPARDGSADRASLRQGGRRLAGEGGRRSRASLPRSARWGSASAPVAAAVDRAVDVVVETVRGAARRRGCTSSRSRRLSSTRRCDTPTGGR